MVQKDVQLELFVDAQIGPSEQNDIVSSTQQNTASNSASISDIVRSEPKAVQNSVKQKKSINSAVRATEAMAQYILNNLENSNEYQLWHVRAKDMNNAIKGTVNTTLKNDLHYLKSKHNTIYLVYDALAEQDIETIHSIRSNPRWIKDENKDQYTFVLYKPNFFRKIPHMHLNDFDKYTYEEKERTVELSPTEKALVLHPVNFRYHQISYYDPEQKTISTHFFKQIVLPDNISDDPVRQKEYENVYVGYEKKHPGKICIQYNTIEDAREKHHMEGQ